MVLRRDLSDQMLVIAVLWIGFGREVALVALIFSLVTINQDRAAHHTSGCAGRDR